MKDFTRNFNAGKALINLKTRLLLRTNKFIIVLATLLFLSAMPFFMGPGLNTPKPIGNYLNGAFPPLSSATAEPYRVAFENLSFFYPITFSNVPSQDRIVIGQLDGKIFWFENDETTTNKNLVVDLSDTVGITADAGFLGLAIHPNFGNGDNFFYVYYTTKDSEGNNEPAEYTQQSCNNIEPYSNYVILERFEVDPATLTIVDGTRTNLLKNRMNGTSHRGGGMDFGNDGFLHITLGDQSTWVQAQDITNNIFGGTLRIDVDKDPNKSHPATRKIPADVGFSDEETGEEYWIPNDNPFVSPDGSNFEEYYSLGLRNPFRMTKDIETGLFYIGDVGYGTHEEVNVLQAGKNFGWPVFEGNVNGPGCLPQLLDNMPHEGPITAFPRSLMNSITGGYVYRGTEVPELYGKYICADYGIGDEIFTVDIETGEYEQLGTFLPTDIISFGQDKAGEVYILNANFNGPIYKMKSVETDYSLFPQLLSETGVFTDLNTLDVNDGIIPYKLVESFWSDGAIKRRWMAVPNNGTHNTVAEQIEYSENGDWDFPVGTVLIKHFDLGIDENDPSITKKIETRFSVKDEDGNFYFLTYNWNEDQTDAVLQTVALDEPIEITTTSGATTTQTWHFPSNSECIACHNSANKGSLGLRTRYLNTDLTYDETGITANQLVTLSHLGIIDETILDEDTPNLLTSKSIYDPNATLDEKARSYMDLNCAYCHRPGTDNRASFDLRLFNSLDATGLLTAGILAPLGIEGEEILSPGDASKSILYHRINSVDPTVMMPPLAKSKIDEDAVTIIEAWINQLDPDTNSINSPDLNINLALLNEAVLTGSVTNGRGTPLEILYDPILNDYRTVTAYNEYGLGFQENIGTPTAEDGLRWQANWPTEKYINYITFGGSFNNQPQPNTLWRISYLNNDVWQTIEEGQGGWINNGIYEWGGDTQAPIIADAVRIQLYSDGTNNLVSTHLRGRGGNSDNSPDDSATNPKAALIQYVPYTVDCDTSGLETGTLVYCDGNWVDGNSPNENSDDANVFIGNEIYLINENIKINDISIADGATVIIEEGSSLTVNGNFTNDGLVQLQSSSTEFSSLIVKGTSTGNISYKRHVNNFNGVNGYDLLSSTVVGQNFGDFEANNPNLYENPDDEDEKLFGPFNELTGEYVTYLATTDSEQILLKGVGYRVARDPEEDIINGTSFTFNGAVETNPVNITITESATDFSGWNLIGNPYASYLDFETFFNLNKTQLDTDTYQAVYGYDGDATDGYIILNTLNFGSKIAPGQGFFVKVKENGGEINFTPEMRVIGNADDFIENRSNNNFVTIKIDNAQKSFETDIYFNPDASLGLNPGYDAGLFNATAPDFSIYSHLVEEHTNEQLAIQVLNENAINNVVIPIGIHASQGDNVEVSISDMIVPNGINIYLEDTSNNTFTLLNTNNYSFTAENDISEAGRFFIRFESTVLNVADENLEALKIYTDEGKKMIVIEGPVIDDTFFKLYDLHGRIINTIDLDITSTSQSISIANLSEGIYLVQLENDLNQRRIKKIIVR